MAAGVAIATDVNTLTPLSIVRWAGESRLMSACPWQDIVDPEIWTIG